MADVALGLVLDCIRHLILLGVVAVIPVFQYSNVYRPTPKLAQLAKCKEMQQRCIEQCTKTKLNIPGSTSAPCVRPKAKIRDIFRIFASMAHGATFGELCVRFNPAALNINERQMVLFGLLEGLIRRVEKYPITVQRNLFYDDEPIRSLVALPPSTVDSITAAEPTTYFNSTKHSVHHSNSGSQPLPRDQRHGKSDAHNTRSTNGDNEMNGMLSRQRNLSISAQGNANHSQNYHYYNGLKSYDEICTKRGISNHQLDSQLAKDRHVIVLLR